MLVVGAAHSDFDGDGCPDVLLFTRNGTQQTTVDVYIFWNVNEKLDQNHSKLTENICLITVLNILCCSCCIA